MRTKFEPNEAGRACDEDRSHQFVAWRLAHVRFAKAKGMGETPMLRDSLNQFDIVPERIAKVKPLITGIFGWSLIGSRASSIFFRHARTFIDFVSDVSPRCAPIDFFFHADVHLAIAGVKPEALTLEHRRPGNLFHAQKAQIELARRR